MIEISKILTVFLDDYDDFIRVGKATEVNPDYKNKIGIGYYDFDILSELQEILKNQGYNIEEIRFAFLTDKLDYINFEYWN